MCNFLCFKWFGESSIQARRIPWLFLQLLIASLVSLQANLVIHLFPAVPYAARRSVWIYDHLEGRKGRQFRR
jgi:hypothetical protein